MALGSTQPLAEMSIEEYFLGGKGGRCVGLTTVLSFMCRLSRCLGVLTSWNPSGPVTGLTGIVLPLPLPSHHNGVVKFVIVTKI